MSKSELKVIGNNSLVKIHGIEKVPAKIDTGATSSAIWASDIAMHENGDLEFSLFGPNSPFYTGERIVVAASQVKVRFVRNSTGDTFIRYQVPLSTVIRGHRMRIRYTLTDRSRNNFPILIGRSTLKGRFVVDCKKVAVPPPLKPEEDTLNAQLLKNPLKFHAKYMENPQKNQKISAK